MTIEARLRAVLISTLLNPEFKAVSIQGKLSFAGFPHLDITWVSEDSAKGVYQGLGAILEDFMRWSRPTQAMQSDMEMAFFQGDHSRPKLKKLYTQDADAIFIPPIHRDSLSAHEILAAQRTLVS